MQIGPDDNLHPREGAEHARICIIAYYHRETTSLTASLKVETSMFQCGELVHRGTDELMPMA